jgi:biotin transport system ATP-binding protein
MKSRLLEARNLRLSFEGGPPFLKGASLSLDAGELVVLAGKNGSGKSLLCKLLSGLIEPESGEVLFEGRGLLSYPGSPALRVGYVFEDARLETLGDRVLDDAIFGPANVGLRRGEAEGKAREALGLVGLSGKEDAFVSSLSGGEMRRLALAGILALGPAVLILDEPFANLDLPGVRSVLRLIVELKASGKALLVATHELEKILGLADRLLVMDGGELVLEGSPEAILAQGVSAYGLRDPLRAPASVRELSWLD